MRKLGAVPVLAAGLALGLVMAPSAQASAQTSTATTFSVARGPLRISLPTTVAMPRWTPGDITSASLGKITVTDLRGAADHSWLVTVTATTFTTGTGTSAETVSPSGVWYASGTATWTRGRGVMTAGQPDRYSAQSLSSTRTAYVATKAVGNDSAAWTPIVNVQVPLGARAGLYRGVITHSIA